ncbi:class I SAM-dependent methyltransferase [Gramella sp. BOM4]|nr:class I SAM-dependent methyltransferase [Christiangramia bathymodioli]
MIFQIKSYLKFLLKSQNEHGLHSPFVYDLVTKCFYDKSRYPEYELIRKYRNDLLSDRSEISVTDFGAGSRVFKSDKRPVFAMAKQAGSTLHRTKLLFRICEYLNVKNALELGTSLGIGSVAMAANAELQLTSIEGCPGIAKKAAEQFGKFRLRKIQLINQPFSEAISKLASEHPTPNYDLIFFDGNHQKEATLEYFERLLPSAHNDSVFIFDDIHWSEGMQEAWEEIKNHPKVRVSIDTFQWGLIFFRKEQAKQHFKIRV